MNFNIKNISKAFIAGLVATIVLTMFMIIQKAAGIMPTLDPVYMMSNLMAGEIGANHNGFFGWSMHFIIGTFLWGGLFSIFNELLPCESQVFKGVSLSLIAWLFVMVGPMPMAGTGLFGLSLGLLAPIITLILHLIYGVVLGMVFIKLKPDDIEVIL